MIPTPGEVDLIAEHIAPQYRLTVYLQSGTGQRPSEALAFSTECRRPGFIRIRWQVSAKAALPASPDCGAAQFVKVGRHVRIPESALGAFIDAHTIQPIRRRGGTLRRAA